MYGLGYACARLLAAVFVRASAAKLARPTATATSFAAVGVPASGLAARAVPHRREVVLRCCRPESAATYTREVAARSPLMTPARYPAAAGG